MTIYEYYVRSGFNERRYLPGVAKDPVKEIAKSFIEGKLKAVFLVSEQRDWRQEDTW